MVSACQPQPKQERSQAPLVVSATVSAPAPAEKPEEPLPKGHYRGVAGVRALSADGCPERYVEAQGVCAHVRLLSMQTKALFARTVADFKRGVSPPIVADAPAPGPRDPSLMEPGALVASEEELARREAGRGPSLLEQFPDSPNAKAKRPGPVTKDKKGAAPEPKDEESSATMLLRMLGSDDSKTSQERSSMGEQLDQLNDHMSMLRDVREMTADGEVSPEDMQRLHTLLGNSSSEFPLTEMVDTMLGSHKGLENLGSVRNTR